MRFRDQIESALSVLLVAAGCVIAISLAHREFFPPTRQVRPPPRPPTYVEDWASLEKVGLLLGKPDAKVKIIEFGDFECPFCRQADSVLLGPIVRDYGKDVAVVFVHFPLTIHRFALAAATAAECAAQQGGFGAMHDVLYSKQDSFGLKPWTSYARDAGIRDTTAFGRCIGSTAKSRRVEEGLAAGRRLSVTGTPTFLVNGWQFFKPPSDTEFRRAVSAILAGRAPYPSTSTVAPR